MKVAIVHHYLVELRGGERVLELLCEIFPDADLYTLIWNPDVTQESQPLSKRKIFTSFLQRLPLAKRRKELYFPFYPMAVEGWDLTGYDLVITSDSACVKGVIVGPETLHICYCHSPMRYVWDMHFLHLRSAPWWSRIGVRFFTHYLRQFDFISAQRVDYFIANSHHIAKKIKKYYRKEATVIYPPVDTDFFIPDDEQQDDFYLYVGALTPYKRVDIIVEAFTRLGKPLKVIGTGPELKKIKINAGRNVQFLGSVSKESVRIHLQRARALVFAAEEDFGIIPVEAQACGKPVIAYGRGGALETIIDGKTGIFFNEQSPNSLISAIDRFERMEFDPRICRQNALKFSKEQSKLNLKDFIHKKLHEWNQNKLLRSKQKTPQ